MHQPTNKSEPMKSQGHIAFVGGYEFYETADGLLSCENGRLPGPKGLRPGEWYTSLVASSFAVRIALLSGYAGPANITPEKRDRRWAGR